MSVPKLVFLVPYRDREQQLGFFQRQMAHVLEDLDKSVYEIYYVHQCDERSFNRGAMKNIGFLAIKEKYPNDYQNITFVFNDVDTMPFRKNFLNYETVPGNIKHFYGFTYTLGGIVSIKGSDFERLNGYPNFWAWGWEDNILQIRVLANNMKIDRDQFYPIFDKNILHFFDGIYKNVNRTEFDQYRFKTREGISNIRQLKYKIDPVTNFIDVTQFDTGTVENVETTTSFDIRTGNAPFKGLYRDTRARMGMMLT
jgi:hypothetical protein